MVVQGQRSLELAITELIAETAAPEILGLGGAWSLLMSRGSRARTMCRRVTLAWKWLRTTGKTAAVLAQTMMALQTAAMALETILEDGDSMS